MRRSPHVITPAEVDGWLADSANTRATYYRTTREAAQDIVEHGVDIAKSRIAAYGQGFYTATEADAFDGEAELLVAIKTRNPLLGGIDQIEELVDEMARRHHDPHVYPDPRGHPLSRPWPHPDSHPNPDLHRDADPPYRKTTTTSGAS